MELQAETTQQHEITEILSTYNEILKEVKSKNAYFADEEHLFRSKVWSIFYGYIYNYPDLWLFADFF